MDEVKVWSIFWFSIVAAICLLIYSCSAQSNREDARKQQDVKTLIAAGQTPVEARCAVYGIGDGSTAIVCQSAVTAAAILKSQKQGLAK